MSVPAFIDLTEANQTTELREYLNSIGAEIKTENSESLKDDIKEIIEASQILWKNGEDRDIEGVINSILSLLFVIPTDQCAPLITQLCEQLIKGGNDGRASLSMRLFHNLFHGFDIKNQFLFDTFCAWITVASGNNCIDVVNTNLEQVQRFLDIWQATPDQRRKILHLLYKAQITCGNSEDASKTINSLLGDYNEENASQAKEDAKICVERALADEKKYLYDHLLTLKPVQALKGEPIYELLQIFIDGNLKKYESFLASHSNFFEENNLCSMSSLRKIQLLTFIDLVTSLKEISFDEIENALGIKSDQIEEFVIDAFQSKMVAGKIDHISKKIIVSHAVQRTFGSSHWQYLEDRLKLWRENLTAVNERLQTVVPMKS